MGLTASAIAMGRFLIASGADDIKLVLWDEAEMTRMQRHIDPLAFHQGIFRIVLVCPVAYLICKSGDDCL